MNADNEALDEQQQVDPELEAKRFHKFCEQHQVDYELHHHPAAHTIEDAKVHTHHIDGAHCKNLFLKSESPKSYWVVTLAADATIDLKDLAAKLGCKRIGFASPIRMAEFLRVKPGAVTPLAVLNDTDQKVKVVFDQSLEDFLYLNFPPLNNTQTVRMSRQNLDKYMAILGREINWQTMKQC